MPTRTIAASSVSCAELPGNCVKSTVSLSANNISEASSLANAPGDATSAPSLTAAMDEPPESAIVCVPRLSPIPPAHRAEQQRGRRYRPYRKFHGLALFAKLVLQPELLQESRFDSQRRIQAGSVFAERGQLGFRCFPGVAQRSAFFACQRVVQPLAGGDPRSTSGRSANPGPELRIHRTSSHTSHS